MHLRHSFPDVFYCNKRCILCVQELLERCSGAADADIASMARSCLESMQDSSG